MPQEWDDGYVLHRDARGSVCGARLCQFFAKDLIMPRPKSMYQWKDAGPEADPPWLVGLAALLIFVVGFIMSFL